MATTSVTTTATTTTSTSISTTHALKLLSFVIALVLLASLTGRLREGLAVQDQERTVSEAPMYLPRAELLRPLSLGYHNVLADILWFRAINYFGKHYRSDRTYPWLAHICDLVTDLDPRAEHVYRFAGLILPWEAGQTDEGIRLLEKGTKAIPDSWSLAYYLGFNYFFFKNDYERATSHLQRAAALPGAHPGVARLAAILTMESAGPDTTMQFLRDLEQNVDSQRVRDVLHRNMAEAAAAAAIRRLEEAVAAYRSAKGHTPASLDELVAAGFIQAVPHDPFGGRFEVDAEGKVASSTGKKPGTTHTSMIRERALQGNSGADLLGK